MKPCPPAVRSVRAISQFEVLLVMALMGVIGAVAVPLYSNLSESSKLTVLKSNLHHMNTILREAHRSGSVLTDLNLSGQGMTVEKVCASLASGAGVFADTDGDGVMDPHEIGFGMDVPPDADPYDYLIGQHLFEDYTIKIHGGEPIQLAVYEEETFHEVP